MSLDKTTALRHAKMYAQLVGEHLRPLKIVLFGSFATGDHTKNSDIDIAVIVNKIDGDFLLISKQLNRFTRNIDSRIEPVLIQNDEDRSGFLTTILETGIILYQN